MDHYQFLQTLHRRLVPQVYLETGVEHGYTLQLSNCIAIGVDPYPQLRIDPTPKMKIFSETSDDFFEKHDFPSITGNLPIDLAFIDGLHLFEAAFQDFINIERHSHPGTVVCVHDVLPKTVKMAGRPEQPDGWTGDVFGLCLALRQNRPDLFVATLDVPDTGMLVISNLDPTSEVLKKNFANIVSQHMALDYSKIHDDRHGVFRSVPYSDLIVDYLAANMDEKRAARQLSHARARLGTDDKIQLGLPPKSMKSAP